MNNLSWEEINALVLKARETERERIIKLLEGEYALAVTFDLEIVQGLGVAVELLRGENK